MTKRIYAFGGGTAEGDKSLKQLLGGKGANLAEMASLGIPVPPGFTITTDICQEYYRNDACIPSDLMEEVREYMQNVEQITGKEFGSPTNPLLLSVRSGAAVSMPGMMDTVLNLGMNDETVEAMAAKTGNPRFAYDAYRRFIQMFGNVVLGVDHHQFEHELEAIKHANQRVLDTELTAEELMQVVTAYKQMLLSLDKSFPQEPYHQLELAIDAVFGSWNNDRAIAYRQIQGLSSVRGTAVNVQAMVFGNMGETSGTGVAFTRNPSTGENAFFGEYLLNAQGEDVVAGIRTPQPLTEHQKKEDSEVTLEQAMPEVFAQLNEIQMHLEQHYKDMQDLEFTIEEGKLYLLQTRTGKRTAAAMLRIAVEMYEAGDITREQALKRIDPNKINELLHPGIDPNASYNIVARGLPASPGVAVGRVVYDNDTAERMVAAGDKVILVRTETSPEDIKGMAIAEGVLTARGGMTSHAAVVARGMGKCCVSGCDALVISQGTEHPEMTLRQEDGSILVVREGEYLSLDGSRGYVIHGKVPTIPPNLGGNLQTVLAWSDEVRSLGVRTNADTPAQAQQAREFGAEGIGLCRTEHMFFDEDRIMHVRSMILADTKQERERALENLLPYQREDFMGIFKAMDGLPVTVRLLDPPLHEFLPEGKTERKMVAETLRISIEKLHERIHSLEELNPMLGMRGCRLGVAYPEITAMQARAIIEAALECKAAGVEVKPEIMIPLVGNSEELRRQREIVDATAAAVFAEQNETIDYTVGTMIELPRACVTADQIAEHADFFSFGTNDLTQTTCGFSRDDSGKFLPLYVESGVLPADPFVTIDQDGVGQLLKMGVDKGRSTKPNLKTGICGEHGGDPASIDFCHNAGLSYVSCSPFRVPVARIAAAISNLE